MECSLGIVGIFNIADEVCLNPYSNGMLTWDLMLNPRFSECLVLILILMECSLGCYYWLCN